MNKSSEERTYTITADARDGTILISESGLVWGDLIKMIDKFSEKAQDTKGPFGPMSEIPIDRLTLHLESKNG